MDHVIHLAAQISHGAGRTADQSQPSPASTTELLLLMFVQQVSKLFADASTVSITSFISPYRADRLIARELHTSANPPIPFIEVHIDVPLEVAEARDPKGLYKKAREGIIKEFTGISAPYEAPENPELKIRTDQLSVEEAVQEIVRYLEKEGYVKLKALALN